MFCLCAFLILDRKVFTPNVANITWFVRRRNVKFGTINCGAGGEPVRCDRDEGGPSYDRSLEDYNQTTSQCPQIVPVITCPDTLPENDTKPQGSTNGQHTVNIILPVTECDREMGVLVTSL